MAVTQGHGNPNWTRDEVILALDLYFDCNGQVPSKSDKRVKALSELLRAFPYHSRAARKESFRNPDGVAFKLQNIRQVATGKGLGNVSQIDRAVWAELGDNPQRTKEKANLIRSGVKIAETADEDSDYEETFTEGRVVTEAHRRRERNPRLRERLIAQRRKAGELCCDVCSCQPDSSEFGEAIFEAHHVVPISATAERITKLVDMALLCANCHRKIHRAIARLGRWLGIDEAKQLFQCPPQMIPKKVHAGIVSPTVNT